RPKLLLPWGKTSVIGHLVQQWRGVGATQIAIVRAADDAKLSETCGELPCIINPAPERGMFSSIQCAAEWPKWNPSLKHWVIALGDQPHLREGTLQQLVAIATQHPNDICQPASSGRARHPVVLPKSAFERIPTTTAADLKAFLASAAEHRRMIEIDDPGLDLDIDTPEDYERAKKLAQID
ncbi:MAG TPA: nucleotidyltransferase family protein, partial [Candidatus Binatia bacterium]|nr:nucleotidyltransferase family protein [Candidatus Binatia bacterium]